MNKAILSLLLFVSILIFAFGIYAHAGLIARAVEPVPEVRYTSPRDDSEVDLTGKSSLTFSWKSLPIPSSGRYCYKFMLFKGFEYGSIVKEELDSDVYSINVPSDKFEDGQTYTWQVKQRAERGCEWSHDLRWSFKVIKK